MVGVNAWVVHRDSSVFGEDVNAFKPERWIGRDKGDMGWFIPQDTHELAVWSC